MSTLAFCRIKDVLDLEVGVGGEGDKLLDMRRSSLEKLWLASSRAPELNEGETDKDLIGAGHSVLLPLRSNLLMPFGSDCLTLPIL